MRKVASIITITDRYNFYIWLDSLPWRISLEEKYELAEKAKVSTRVLWSIKTGFLFW